MMLRVGLSYRTTSPDFDGSFSEFQIRAENIYFQKTCGLSEFSVFIFLV